MKSNISQRRAPLQEMAINSLRFDPGFKTGVIQDWIPVESGSTFFDRSAQNQLSKILVSINGVTHTGRAALAPDVAVWSSWWTGYYFRETVLQFDRASQPYLSVAPSILLHQCPLCDESDVFSRFARFQPWEYAEFSM